MGLFGGLAAVLPTADGKWGFIDTTGHFAIEPQFDNYPAGYVAPFSDGYASIESKQRVGYIDKTGQFAITPRFLRGFVGRVFMKVERGLSSTDRAFMRHLQDALISACFPQV